MRALLLALLLFIGLAGATMPTPTYNFGPDSGISVQQLVVQNDAQIKGNLYTNGTVVTDGAIGTDMLVGSGIDLRFTGGNSLFDMGSASGYIKTPTGINYLNGDVLLKGGANLTGLTGDGIVDFRLMTGTFNAPQGVATMTNGGTVPTGKTWTITDADKLLVGSKIIPDRVIITIPFTAAQITAQEINGTVFIADAAYKVLSIEEVHPVAETTATTATISPMKATGTQAMASGTLLTTAAMSLKSTAETTVTPALSATPADYTFADGDRLGLWFKTTGGSTVTQFKRGCITITLQRV